MALPGVPALAVDPATPATLYAGAVGLDGKGYYYTAVYKSSNGGGSWTVSSTGIPDFDNRILAEAVDPLSPATVYAATTLGVYKSTNGGGTWALSSTGPPPAAISVLVASPAGEPALYVGTAAGLYKSTHAGASWTRADAGVTNPNITALALAPSSPATLYASAATSGSDAFVARISP